MNLLSSELHFHVHNWLIITLKDFCIVIRKWPTFWPSTIGLHTYVLITFKLVKCIINTGYTVVIVQQKCMRICHYLTRLKKIAFHGMLKKGPLFSISKRSTSVHQKKFTRHYLIHH